MKSDTWHRVGEVRVDEGRAQCSICGPDARVLFKPSKGRWVCRVADSRRTPEARRRYHLRYKFQISDADYDSLLAAQGQACAICGLPCSTGRHLAVDHDHETGRVRGLLCNRCNRSIGLLNDDPELLLRAVAYLNK